MNIQEVEKQIKALQFEVDRLSEIVKAHKSKMYPLGVLYGKQGTNNLYTIFKEDDFIKILNVTYGKVWEKQLGNVRLISNHAGWNHITYRQLYSMVGNDADKFFVLDKINIDNNSLTTKLTRDA